MISKSKPLNLPVILLRGKEEKIQRAVTIVTDALTHYHKEAYEQSIKELLAIITLQEQDIEILTDIINELKPTFTQHVKNFLHWKKS